MGKLVEIILSFYIGAVSRHTLLKSLETAFNFMLNEILFFFSLSRSFFLSLSSLYEPQPQLSISEY